MPESNEKLKESDVEWTNWLAGIVRQEGEIEEIETNSDSPERISKNEFFFYTRYSDDWPAFRVVVEPVALGDQKMRANTMPMKRYKVPWQQVPTNYSKQYVIHVDAVGENEAKEVTKDHIERTKGLSRNSIRVGKPEEYHKPTGGRVINE